MSLSKQQKFDMIRDVELRIAKEELAEQYLKDVKTIESSDKPLRTLKEIMESKETSVEQPATPDNDVVIGEALHDHQTGELSDLHVKYVYEHMSLEPDADVQKFDEQYLIDSRKLKVKHDREWHEMENSSNPSETEQAILERDYKEEDMTGFEILKKIRQESGYQTNEEKELLEQSEIAAKTPFEKSIDSLSQWKSIGRETLAMQGAEQGVNIQEHFENAQSMSNDNDMGMER
ncbi:MAG: hypothetical protein KUF77_09845 [Candidatus Thiodiazotropha sp. (ex Lucina aurantia)]|nr:hypothetical protein [Candidatus Thiodiazotropha taylori]MBV2097815.1 hypothetical protein [Candidatus Thiodiazotropha sp. (ex Codakia orbicularis)]MBV2103312.1 hypothetical protein [Candidatus Thiodiazotropha sp. (ex Lucina aurantia)]MBV2116325.1 hypothetical protein [Candidatus Thiodiazotropha sp. (ex Lucina aurantia)]